MEKNISTILGVVKRKLASHRRLSIAATILLLIVLLVSFVPTYFARYLIADVLEDLGIEHEGIKTVKVNLWKREAWAGPFRFRTGEVDHALLGELGIKINLFPFLKKHAMVERVLVRGIDVYVARAEDNTLTLNGIPLEQFMAQSSEPAPSIEQASSWGAALGKFEMLESRLIFREKTGGTLTLEIERLRLDDFTSWLPDEPGLFELKAQLNEIELDLKGQARPFAQHITVNVDSEAREADLPKIIQFTGPFGLEREAGTYRSTLHHEITLFDSGRLEGLAVGKISLVGADYARAERFALATEQADIDIDVRYSLSEDVDFQVEGRVNAELVNANGKLPGDHDFVLANAKIDLAELSASYGSDNTLKLESKPTLNITQGGYSGRIQLSMDTFMDVLYTLQSISTRKKITKEDTGLGKWSGDEVTLPKSDITVTQFNGKMPMFKLSTAKGKVSLELAVENEVNGLKLATEGRHFDIGIVRGTIKKLHLKSGDGKTGLIVSANQTLNEVVGEGPIGKGTIKTVKFNESIDLKIDRGDIALQGSAKGGVKGSRIFVHKTDALPQAQAEIVDINAEIKKLDFSLVKEQVKWQVDSGASIDNASLHYDKGKLSAAKIKRFVWRGASADQDMNIATDKLTINGLEVSLRRQFVDGMLNDQDTDSVNKAAEEKQVKSTSEKAEEEKPVDFHLKLGRFELIDGAKLKFLDKQVQPPIVFNLDIKTAEIHNIDSRNPKSTPKVDLVATINEFTDVSLHSTARNEGTEMDLELSGKVKNLELPPYSSYVAEFGGVNVESGQFNSEVDIKATKGELDGNIKLYIRDLEFTPLSQADAERLSEKAGMPIKTAANMLKDNKGNIRLSLPVSGTVVEPEVDISSGISKAVGNTLKTIFPPTLIGSMLSSMKEGGEQTFKPILFDAGDSSLKKEAKVYLDDLTMLLNERPALAINICGRATPDDFEAMTLKSLKLPPDAKPEAREARQRLINRHSEKLLKLATERTRVVRRYLITAKGLDAGRVSECRLGFNPDDTESPRVIVTL